MADTLGVVSGGMAVVSLAIQLAESIKKIKDFYQAVREAPDTVWRTIDELETLSLVLEDVDRSMQEHVFLDLKVKTIVLKSYRLCRSSSEAIKAVVDELEKSLVKGKKRGGFKTALKKDKLHELGVKLDSAKSTLLLANQIYYQAVQNQKWESLEQDILQLQSLQRHHHDDIKNQFTRFQLAREGANWCASEVKTLSNRKPHNTRQYKTNRIQLIGSRYISGVLEIVTAVNETSEIVKTISVNLPRWIHARRYDFSLKRSYQGWDANFRTYKQVPYEALIFDYCIDGNVVGLQKLFQSGAASPFEIDPDGRTPLHYAALYARPEACRFLLENGADATAPTSWCGNFHEGRPDSKTLNGYVDKGNSTVFCGDTNYSTPLHFLVEFGANLLITGREDLSYENHSLNPPAEEDFRNTLQVLVERGGSDPFQEDQHKRTAYHCFTAPGEFLKWLVGRDELMMANLDSHEILELLINQLYGQSSWTASERIRYFLPRGCVTREIAQLNIQDHWLGWDMGQTLPHFFLISWIHVVARSKGYFPEPRVWEELISESLTAGWGVHYLAPGGSAHLQYTPLLSIIKEFSQIGVLYSRRQKRKILVSWLELLVKTGYDLLDYGQEEIDMHANGISSWSFYERIRTSDRWYYTEDCAYKVCDIKFGPTPEDWHIEFEDSWVILRYPAEFWHWVEDLGDEGENFQKMPGSWCDD